ncbi:MAG: hypothetical protein AAGE96_18825, partial [Cyanobacteria bacterium P01_G01_bin.19]
MSQEKNLPSMISQAFMAIFRNKPVLFLLISSLSLGLVIFPSQIARSQMPSPLFPQAESSLLLARAPQFSNSYYNTLAE